METENLENPVSETHHQRTKNYRVRGIVIVVILIAYFVAVMAAHKTNLLGLVPVAAIYFVIWGITQIKRGKQKWGLSLCLIAFCSVMAFFGTKLFFDNVQMLSVSPKHSTWTSYSVFAGKEYTNEAGATITMKGGNAYLSNNTRETLVVYAVRYSVAPMDYTKPYKIVQSIPPQAVVQLVHKPDYLFEDPSDRIFITVKKGQRAEDEERYYLEYKREMKRIKSLLQ